MIKRVILIGYQPLTEKVKEDFYFSELLDHNFEVTYWDLSAIYFPNVLNDTLNDQNIVKILDYDGLVAKLGNCQINECLFLLNITYEYRVIRLFRILTKFNCTLSFFARGALPVSNRKINIKEKIIKSMDAAVLFNFMKNRYAGFLKKIGFIKLYDIVFNAGQHGYLTVGVGADCEKKHSSIVEINSHDYDNYLDSLLNKSYLDYTYCVFLDEYLPHHPDFKLLGIQTVDSENYYKSLNSFFDYLERKFKIPVVIASHPKADMYKDMNPYNGRKIIWGRTGELTKHASFVLAHISTSQSYAILNNKPIITLNCNSIKDRMPHYSHFITHFSEQLNSQLINTDLYSDDDVSLKEVDPNLYGSYRYNYLTSTESEQKKSSVIFLETLSKL